MNRQACTTSGPSATSGDTSSPSGAPPAVPPPSSGPPGAPPAGSGTGTPSTTATGSTPSPPRPAELPPPARPRVRFPRPPWIDGIGALRDLLPAAFPDLSPPAVARWPAHASGECPRCGAFEGPGPAHSSLCGPCSTAPPPFDAARSLFAYAGDVRAAIVAAKYAGRPYPVDAVALRLHEALVGGWRDLIPDGSLPTVVPVPAHPWKYFRRGCNLPALIASRLSRRAGLPFDPLTLSRARGRVPQAGLPRILRRGNVEGTFAVPRGRKVPAAVLLLDDVYTSGATAAACARALKSAGAVSIVVVTVARAVP